MKKEIEINGFFLEPTDQDFVNPIYNFTKGGQYRRIDLVIASGVFVSAMLTNVFEEYPLIPLGATATDGSCTATGQEVPILGERRLQVSLMETPWDLLMSFKIIEWI